MEEGRCGKDKFIFRFFASKNVFKGVKYDETERLVCFMYGKAKNSIMSRE